MSQTLKDARKYEKIAEEEVKNEERPEFHLSARVGWLNDPNGFSFYDGKYHLFYQYHPYDSHWGPMHWGHAVSEDLLHWTHLPAALAPDRVCDEAGCFSGSALTLPDGRHLLMYTGVCSEVQSDGCRRDIQTQCIAIGDGLDYEKYQGNPVLDKKIYLTMQVSMISEIPKSGKRQMELIDVLLLTAQRKMTDGYFFTAVLMALTGSTKKF